MGYKLRHLPEECLVEITCRAIQRRFLFTPSEGLNRIIIGALARGQRRYNMKICGFVYLSNHAHLQLIPENAKQMADFMRYVNSKIAREAGRMHHWREKLWGRRYTDVIVSQEPEAQISRLRYLLEQGCKEKLVASPRHWPGASSVEALTRGGPIDGVWVDRTQQHRARERNKPTADSLFTSTERLELSPLPCWEELTEAQHQTQVRRIVREIEESMEGVSVLGKQAILAQDPHDRPKTLARRSPAPRFHAIAPKVRRALERAYQLFKSEYREAAEDLRLGKADVCFPPGSFPGPGLFVPLKV